MSRSFLDGFSKFLSSSKAASEAEVARTLIHANWQGRALVTEIIQPGQLGRVWFQATTWFAVCPYQAVLPPDTPVRVVGRYDTVTLIVEPVLSVVSSGLSSFDNAA
jgi:hypothetical protein